MGTTNDDKVYVTVQIDWREPDEGKNMTEAPLERGYRYPDSEDGALGTFLYITHDLRGQKWVVSGKGVGDEYNLFLLEAYGEALQEAFTQMENDGLVQTPATILDSVYQKLEGWGRIKFYEGGEDDE